MDNKEWVHIGDAPCFLRQKLLWKDLPENVRIDLEIVNFFTKSKVYTCNDGAYQDFVVVFHTRIEEPLIEKEDMVLIGFAYKTLANALYNVPLYQKKHINRSIGEDNVLISFTKTNKKYMRIHNIERRAAAAELTEEANKIWEDDTDEPEY